ncbi:MAG: hypothetical protein ACI8W8_002729, partial [Rhodothermales bacterium]
MKIQQLVFTIFLLCICGVRADLRPGFFIDPDTQITLPDGFDAEQLYTVPTSQGSWVAMDAPLFLLSQGNPPSGIAAWYCLVDVVALTVGPWLALR